MMGSEIDKASSEATRMIAWARRQFPSVNLKQVVEEFQISDQLVWLLSGCMMELQRDHKRARGIRSNRLLASKAKIEAYEAARSVAEASKGRRFLPAGSGFKVVIHLPEALPNSPLNQPPFNRPSESDEAIPISMLVKMLDALIEKETEWLDVMDAEENDFRVLGNNADRWRYAYWFALAKFWHYELGRRLGTSTDPITGNPTGPLVRFILAMSEGVFDNEPTPHSVRSFVRKNKKRVMEDPEFGHSRIPSEWPFE